MKYDHLVFWQLRPSTHQAPWIREISGLAPECRVTCVFQEGLSQERIALGWSTPDYGESDVFEGISEAQMAGLLNGSQAHTTHVFSSLNHPLIKKAFQQAANSSAMVGILSEGRDWRGMKGKLRKIDALRNERGYRKKVSFVLAIGKMGVQWFKSCGYQERQVFPFSYVVESNTAAENKFLPNKAGVFQIAAVGRLIPLKRFGMLLESLSDLKHFDWRLKIVGDGELRKDLEEIAVKNSFAERVDFTRVLDNQKVRGVLEESDLLVLPSTWDGWGAVVNEALMSGVPVVCSDFCGASDLISQGFNGRVFSVDSKASLTEALAAQLAKGTLSQYQRETLRSWSDCISGETVARYFLDILSHCTGGQNRPVAPWSRPYED